ncbi:MAG: helix-turn-helix transcriptional regulator [Mariprofundaceae bacterium]
MDELITTREAAEMLGIKYQTLRKHVMQGKQPQPIDKLRGRVSMFRKKDVEKLLTEEGQRV